MKQILSDRQLQGKVLKESIKARVAIDKLTEIVQYNPLNKWYSKKQAADYVGLSTRQLDRYRANNKIKSYQTVTNGNVRFKKIDLDKFLKGH